MSEHSVSVRDIFFFFWVLRLVGDLSSLSPRCLPGDIKSRYFADHKEITKVTSKVKSSNHREQRKVPLCPLWVSGLPHHFYPKNRFISRGLVSEVSKAGYTQGIRIKCWSETCKEHNRSVLLNQWIEIENIIPVEMFTVRNIP